MKIEKYKKFEKYKKTYEGSGGIDYHVKSDYTVDFTHDRIFIRTLDKSHYLVITVEPQDILKLLTHYVGQEKHKQEKLTSLRKNQKKLNLIRDEIVDCGFGNITVVDAYEKIQDIVSSNKETKTISQGLLGFDIDKIKHTKRLVEALIEIAKTGNTSWTRGLLNPPTYNQASIKRLLESITGKDIKDL